MRADASVFIPSRSLSMNLAEAKSQAISDFYLTRQQKDDDTSNDKNASTKQERSSKKHSQKTDKQNSAPRHKKPAAISTGSRLSLSDAKYSSSPEASKARNWQNNAATQRLGNIAKILDSRVDNFCITSSRNEEPQHAKNLAHNRRSDGELLTIQLNEFQANTTAGNFQSPNHRIGRRTRNNTITRKPRLKEYRRQKKIKETTDVSVKCGLMSKNLDFPPLHVTPQLSLVNHSNSSHESRPGWSTVIKNAHVFSLNKLKMKHHQQLKICKVRSDCLSPLPSRKKLSDENHHRPQKPSNEVVQCKDDDSVPSDAIEVNGGLSLVNLERVNRVNPAKLKQRWVRIWNSTVPAESEHCFISKPSLLEDIDYHGSSKLDPVHSYHWCASCEDDSSSSASSNSSCSESTSILASSYMRLPFPTHAAIVDGNLVALRNLLCLPTSLSRYEDFVSWDDLLCSPTLKADETRTKMKPIHLSILLDNFLIVKVILEHESKDGIQRSVNALDDRHQTPLMLAVYLGLEPHISLLLEHGAKLNIKDIDGDTALHYCCRTDFLSGLELILSAKNMNAIQMQRLLCTRNGQGKTPYHAACAAGCTAIMEKLLSVYVSASVKAMQLCDDFGRTPLHLAVEVGAVGIVELLVLRRRNQQRLSKLKSYYNTRTSSVCPLLLAVQKGNIEMMRVLLELAGDFLNSRYASSTLDNALLLAVQSDSSAPFQRDAIVLLLEAGANPFASIDSLEYDNCLGFSVSKSVVALLARRGDISPLKLALDSFRLVSKDTRAQRRQDHFLRSRPSSFFDTLEEKDDETFRCGMQEALVESLFSCWKNSSKTVKLHCKHLVTSAFLLKAGAALDESGFARLVAGFSRAWGKRVICCISNCHTKYVHPAPGDLNPLKQMDFESHIESSMGYWSSILFSIPWIWSCYDNTTIICGWWLEKFRVAPTTNVFEGSTDVCFLVIGQDRLIAHKSILSSKSKKLAAAFSFSSLKHHDDRKCDEVELDIPLRLLGFLMQHCYHGSIFFGLSSDADACRRELMDLCLIADEYLCPSLLEECEMRLISRKTNFCVCWCCCSTVTTVTGSEGYAHAPESCIECEYSVCTPSALITAKSAIEVLLLSQQLATCHNEYTIQVYGFDSTTCPAVYPVHQPFLVAKSIALKSILFEYITCLESDSHQDYCHQLLPGYEATENQDKLLPSMENDELLSLELLKYSLEGIAKSLPLLSGHNVSDQTNKTLHHTALQRHVGLEEHLGLWCNKRRSQNES